MSNECGTGAACTKSMSAYSRYREYAPFVRHWHEEKAHTYDKGIYHQLGRGAVHGRSNSPTIGVLVPRIDLPR